jgi:hypothetical protein
MLMFRLGLISIKPDAVTRLANVTVAISDMNIKDIVIYAKFVFFITRTCF